VSELGDGLNQPHGGTLVDLVVDGSTAAELKAAARDFPSWALTPRQLCDLELLATGAFSPLRGFLSQRDYNAVCESVRLSSGLLWPIPITLDIPELLAMSLRPQQHLNLCDGEGLPLAVLEVADVWRPDVQREAEAVFGTTNPDHPGVAQLLHRTHPFYVGGTLRVLQLPNRYDFRSLRLTPHDLRADFSRMGWRRIVGFQTRNPMHRAHHEVTLRAANTAEATLLLHPVVGQTMRGDVDHYTRVRCYKAILPRYSTGTVKLALLPLAMRMAGPREALWHGLIRKNFGCTHFIVGRDHASPGKDSRGVQFYGRYDAQQLFRRHETEMGISLVAFDRLLYVPKLDRYVAEGDVPAGTEGLTISGTELRQRLAAGREIPEWFTFPEVAQELRRSHPQRARQGVTVLFTGLPGAGKSTIANILAAKLQERGGRVVTLLDGDVVRKHLSSDLGFSKADRDTNVRRIGFVAAEVTRHGGVALCAPIAPYDSVRKELRAAITFLGGFVLVYVVAPLDVCEGRDPKGLYAKARAGRVANFTGLSDPYEPPDDADVVVDTTILAPEEAAERVWDHLEREGYVPPAQES